MFSMPFFSVAVDDGQPAHEPRRFKNTVPDLPSKPRKMMSPPSCATAGPHPRVEQLFDLNDDFLVRRIVFFVRRGRLPSRLR